MEPIKFSGYTTSSYDDNTVSINTRHREFKTFGINNSDSANSLVFSLMGYLSADEKIEKKILTDKAVSHGDSYTTNISSSAYHHVKFKVKDSVSGSHATYYAEAYLQ